MVEKFYQSTAGVLTTTHALRLRLSNLRLLKTASAKRSTSRMPRPQTSRF